MIITKAKLSLMYGQVPVEIEIALSDDEGLTANEVKSGIDSLIEQGFTPRTYSRTQTADVVGKKGTVESVTAVQGTRMFEVVGKIDDVDTPFKWREFQAHTFRKNDRFIVVVNDRGFKQGQLIIDDGEQQVMAF